MKDYSHRTVVQACFSSNQLRSENNKTRIIEGNFDLEPLNLKVQVGKESQQIWKGVLEENIYYDDKGSQLGWRTTHEVCS